MQEVSRCSSIFFSAAIKFDVAIKIKNFISRFIYVESQRRGGEKYREPKLGI